MMSEGIWTDLGEARRRGAWMPLENGVLQKWKAQWSIRNKVVHTPKSSENTPPKSVDYCWQTWARAAHFTFFGRLMLSEENQLKPIQQNSKDLLLLFMKTDGGLKWNIRSVYYHHWQAYKFCNLHFSLSLQIKTNFEVLGLNSFTYLFWTMSWNYHAHLHNAP